MIDSAPTNNNLGKNVRHLVYADKHPSEKAYWNRRLIRMILIMYQANRNLNFDYQVLHNVDQMQKVSGNYS